MISTWNPAYSSKSMACKLCDHPNYDCGKVYEHNVTCILKNWQYIKSP